MCRVNREQMVIPVEDGLVFLDEEDKTLVPSPSVHNPCPDT